MDNARDQLKQACGNRSTASLLEYLIAVYESKRKRLPDCTPDDPKLYLDFTQDQLASKLMLSTRTIKRAIGKLRQLRLLIIITPSGYDRSYRYQINQEALKSVYQPMPLFDAVQNDPHGDKMSPSMVTPCHHAWGQNVPFDGDKMSPCISSLSLSFIPSSSLGATDAKQQENQEEKASQLQPLPSHAGIRSSHPPESEDADKQSIIDQCRGFGIAKERTELLLTQHSRQDIHAAIQITRSAEKRMGARYRPAAVLIDFLNRPWHYGYERNVHGILTAARELQSNHSKPREHQQPELSEREQHRRAAETAWQSLPYSDQLAIRRTIDAVHSEKPQALRLSLYHQEALKRSLCYGEEQTIHESSAEQGTSRQLA